MNTTNSNVEAFEGPHAYSTKMREVIGELLPVAIFE